MTTIDLASCLATIPDRRRAEGKMYGQVGVILFSVIAMLSGARSYRQIHTLILRRLALLNAAFPNAALRRAPAYTSVRGILQQLDPAELERAFRRHAEGLDRACDGAPSRFIAIDGNPGVMARLRSQALNIARANGVTNIANALYTAAIDPAVSLSYPGL
jgi:hypothetical protein